MTCKTVLPPSSMDSHTLTDQESKNNAISRRESLSPDSSTWKLSKERNDKNLSE